MNKKRSGAIAAIIDIGSHSVKMTIAQGEQTRMTVLEDAWVPVAVGTDTFEKGAVSNTTLAELITILSRFKSLAESYDVKDMSVFATTGIREASNSDIVIERIRLETGLEVRLLDAIEEASILYSGAERSVGGLIKDSKNPALILSLGGGSTQTIIRRFGKVTASDSHSIGTMKMADYLQQQPKILHALFEKNAGRFLLPLSILNASYRIGTLVIINDDIQAYLKTKKVKKHTSGVYVCDSGDFISFAKDILAGYLATSDVSATCVSAFLTGAAVMNVSQADKVLIPDISLSKAYLSTILLGRHGGAALFEKIIKNSAQSLCKKYGSNLEHAERVAGFSEVIFNSLKDHYSLSRNDRLYLETAALLHNVGYFIGSSDHHKHTAHIIENSEIAGLSRKEMQIIAHIARYHTKSAPKSTHPEFMRLDAADRVTVTRVASFLRIADKLDTLSKPVVDSIRCVFDGENTVTLQISMKKNAYEMFDMVASDVRKNADMFTGFFGLELQIERLV